MKGARLVTSCLVFVLLLAFAPLTSHVFYHDKLLVPGFWGMFVFITGLTILMLVTLWWVHRINVALYPQAFLGLTVIKLLGCLFFALFLINRQHPDKVPFVLDIIYIYFSNMAFEIYCLLSNLRDQKK